VSERKHKSDKLFPSILSRQVTRMFCQYFIPDKKVLEHATGYHDKVKNELREKLEREGFKVATEVECMIKIDDFFIMRGFIDVVASRNNTVHIYEVKSYNLERATLADLYQLSMYYHGMFNLKYKSLISPYVDKKAFLVYKTGSDIVQIEVSKEYLEALYQHVKNFLTSSGSHLLLRYVLGSHCRFCASEKCPFNVRFREEEEM